MINWQSLYFVFFTENTAEDKFAFYNAHVYVWQPLLIGLALGLLTPAITWAGTWWTEKFTTRVKVIQAGAVSSVLIAEMRFEKERAKAQAETALIVDETLGKIEDEEVRDKFRDDALSESRGLMHQGHSVLLENLGPDGRYILKRMTALDGGPLIISRYVDTDKMSINGQPLKADKLAAYLLALEVLLMEGLIKSLVKHDKSIQVYQVTEEGLAIAAKLAVIKG